jgi:hypothetical protein
MSSSRKHAAEADYMVEKSSSDGPAISKALYIVAVVIAVIAVVYAYYQSAQITHGIMNARIAAQPGWLYAADPGMMYRFGMNHQVYLMSTIFVFLAVLALYRIREKSTAFAGASVLIALLGFLSIYWMTALKSGESIACKVPQPYAAATNNYDDATGIVFVTGTTGTAFSSAESIIAGTTTYSSPHYTTANEGSAIAYETGLNDLVYAGFLRKRAELLDNVAYLASLVSVVRGMKLMAATVALMVVAGAVAAFNLYQEGTISFNSRDQKTIMAGVGLVVLLIALISAALMWYTSTQLSKVDTTYVSPASASAIAA